MSSLDPVSDAAQQLGNADLSVKAGFFISDKSSECEESGRTRLWVWGTIVTAGGDERWAAH